MGGTYRSGGILLSLLLLLSLCPLPGAGGEAQPDPFYPPPGFQQPNSCGGIGWVGKALLYYYSGPRPDNTYYLRVPEEEEFRRLGGEYLLLNGLDVFSLPRKVELDNTKPLEVRISFSGIETRYFVPPEFKNLGWAVGSLSPPENSSLAASEVGENLFFELSIPSAWGLENETFFPVSPPERLLFGTMAGKKVDGFEGKADFEGLGYNWKDVPCEGSYVWNLDTIFSLKGFAFLLPPDGDPLGVMVRVKSERVEEVGSFAGGKLFNYGGKLYLEVLGERVGKSPMGVGLLLPVENCSGWGLAKDPLPGLDMPPISRVKPIRPYERRAPFRIEAWGLDDRWEVERVELWYRYSPDKKGWGEWRLFGVDEQAPWSWEFNGSPGYYEFYSIATDEKGQREEPPPKAEASCFFSPPLILEAGAPVTSLAFSPLHLAYSTLDGKVFVRKKEDWDLEVVLEAEGPVHQVEFSPDGSLMAYGGRDRMVHVYRTEDWSEIPQSPLAVAGIDVTSVTFSPDGRWLAFGTGWEDGYIYVFDTSEWRMIARFWHWGACHTKNSLSFSPDGSFLAFTASYYGTYVARTSDWSVVKWFGGPIEHGMSRFSVRFSPDGRFLAWGEDWDRRVPVHRHDPAGDWPCEIVLEPGEPIYALDFSPAGDLIAFGGGEGVVHVCETAEWKEVFRLEGARGAITQNSLRFSPDGRFLAFGSADNRVYICLLALDITPPVSRVNPIEPYWQLEELRDPPTDLRLRTPIQITAYALDDLSGVERVELWYRYSLDNWTDKVVWKKRDWRKYGENSSPERTASPLSLDFSTPPPPDVGKVVEEGTGESEIVVEKGEARMEGRSLDGVFTLYAHSTQEYPYGILEIRAKVPSWAPYPDGENKRVFFGFGGDPAHRHQEVGVEVYFGGLRFFTSRSTEEVWAWDFSLNPREYHTYKVEWLPGEARLYVDGELLAGSELVPQIPLPVTLRVFTASSGFSSSLSVDWLKVKPSWRASWEFEAPEGYGYYEFYSMAVDRAGNVEDVPRNELGKIVADAGCRVAKQVLLKVGVIIARPNDVENLGPIDNVMTTARIVPQYFDEVSYGALAIAPLELITDNGGWFRLSRGWRYYGTKEWWQLHDRTKEFGEEAIRVAGIPHGVYDIIIVVFAGPSEQLRWIENFRPVEDRMWEAYYGSTDATNHLIVISEFSNPLYNWQWEDIVWAHEIGHALGLPDLYPVGEHWWWPWEFVGNVDDWGLMGTRCKVHLCSWSKERLGWLKYRDLDSNVTAWVKSLPNLGYGAEVPRRWTDGLFDDEYFVFEVRSQATRYSAWDTHLPADGLVLYKYYNPWIGDSSLNVVFNPITGRNYFLPRDEYWLSPPLIHYPGVLLSVLEDQATENAYEMKIQVREVWHWKRRITVRIAPFPQWRFSSGPTAPPLENYLGPDLDLHAYTVDGKHVGVNYRNGEYEVQIPGAIASGESYNSSEWISVPDNIEVFFTVSSHDVASFIKNPPLGLKLENENGFYALSLCYFDENMVGSGSDAENQVIRSGAEAFHSFSIERRPEGTYSVLVKPGMDLMSLKAWQAAIEDIPDNIFINNPRQRKNALKEKSQEVLEELEEANEKMLENDIGEAKEHYQEAIEKLSNDILKKLDADGKADWVKQPVLVREIRALTAKLSYEMKSMEVVV